MLPSLRLMARAFHPVTPKVCTTFPSARRLSNSALKQKWEGRQPEENTARHKDSYNVQQEASKDGREEKAKGQGSKATTEKSGNSNEKAKEEFPEAPDTIGMQDERGRNTAK